jgi:hypothetical protein
MSQDLRYCIFVEMLYCGRLKKEVQSCNYEARSCVGRVAATCSSALYILYEVIVEAWFILGGSISDWRHYEISPSRRPILRR